MSNFSRDIKGEMEDIKAKVKNIGNEKQSLAYEMLQEQRKQNKRLYIIAIILCLMLAGVTIYTIWLLNDITVVETTEEYNQDIDNDGNIDNSNIINGGNIYDKD